MPSNPEEHSWKIRNPGAFGNRTKEEVTKEKLEEFVAAHPELQFDGMRYTTSIKMRGGIWKKPVAAIVGDKYYLLYD